MPSSLVDWQSGYGPPPEPPPRDYSNPNDNRLRTRFEACRNGMQELDVLRAKHSLLIQNLRSRLPVIPGSIDDVQTREKKPRDVFLDRFSLQSVDSGISSQNTMNSTRCSSPEDFQMMNLNMNMNMHPLLKNFNRHSNIYENSSTMNYSTFRKLSLESHRIGGGEGGGGEGNTSIGNSNSNNNNNINMNNNNSQDLDIGNTHKQMAFVPPVITSRSCHRGAWKTSPKRNRPKSMFETPTNEYLYEKPPRHPIDLSKDRRSAFTIISPSVNKRHSTIDQSTTSSFSQLNLNDDVRVQHKPLRTAQKPEVIRRARAEKADAMFRANFVYVSSLSPEEQPNHHRPPNVRFSPARSPPVFRAQLVENNFHAMPCKIRSPKLNSKSVFAARPIAVRPSISPKIAQHHSTWLQSQPL